MLNIVSQISAAHGVKTLGWQGTLQADRADLSNKFQGVKKKKLKDFGWVFKDGCLLFHLKKTCFKRIKTV